MIGLNNSIYATLFPYLRKPAAPVPVPSSETDPAENEDFVSDPTLSGLTLGNDTLPYSEATARNDDLTHAVQPLAPMPPPTAQTAVQDPSTPTAGTGATNLAQNLQIKPMAPIFDTKGVEAVITKTPLETARKKAEAVAAEPTKKQAAWKNVLWAALQGADMVFGGRKPSDLTWLGEEKKNRKVVEANRELAPLEAQEKRELEAQEKHAKVRKANADYQGVMLTNEGKVIGNATAAGKQAYETLQKKQFITPDEAAAYQKQFGIPINPYDARTFDTRYENGKPYAVPKVGIPAAIKNDTLPDRQREYEVPVKVGDAKGVTTSKDGLRLAADVEREQTRQRLARQQQEAAKQEKVEARQYASEKERLDDVQEWQKRNTANISGLKKAETELKSLLEQKTANKGYAEENKNDSRIAQLQGEIEEKKTAMANDPKPTGQVVAQNANGQVRKIYPRKGGSGKTSFTDALNKVKAARK